MPSPHSFQEQAWRILCQISLFTRASFEACKRFGSGEFHTLEDYALYRLATHMEEPGRSRVKSLIGKALLFCNVTVPKSNLPLHIPFLAHDNFRTNLETWIRQHKLQHKNAAGFLPTHRLREQGCPKSSEILHNHGKMERRWKTSHIQNLPCCCTVLPSSAKHIQKQDMSPSTWTTSTCHQSYTSLPTPMPTLRNSTYFLCRSQYFNICSKAVTRWLKHHGLPPQLAFAFMQKITTEWKLH